MTYKILLSRQAKKFLSGLEKKTEARIIAKLHLLSEPFEVDHVKIKGSPDTYRTRVGDYRILYIVFHDKKFVVISKIDKRSRVYKR